MRVMQLLLTESRRKKERKTRVYEDVIEAER